MKKWIVSCEAGTEEWNGPYLNFIDQENFGTRAFDTKTEAIRCIVEDYDVLRPKIERAASNADCGWCINYWFDEVECSLHEEDGFPVEYGEGDIYCIDEDAPYLGESIMISSDELFGEKDVQILNALRKSIAVTVTRGT